jgi:GH15 family glucan-1,4-alpha-glucosidase
MREAERQKEEAIQYAQSIQTENNDLKSKYQNLNTNYSGEFEKRVKSDLEAAQIKLKEAIANNDIDEQVKAQTMLAGLSMDSTRLDAMKKIREQVDQQAVEEQTRQPVMQQTPAATPAPDPKADAWAAKNTWFGTDNAMTYSAFDIHKKLVEEEGFDPTSDEYYSEVDKRIRLEFPHKFANNKESTAEQPAQTVASAKRPATKGRRKTVKLTPSQVAISKRLGVPLEEYAKQLAAKEV